MFKYLYLANLKVFATKHRSKILAAAAFSLLLNLGGCQNLFASNSQVSSIDRSKKTIWSDDFAASNWQQNWHIRSQKNWGLENIRIIKDPSGKFENILRVVYPAGSASPTVSRRHGAPLGGAGFYAELDTNNAKRLRLTYYLRFSENFDFVKGGQITWTFWW